MPWTSTYLASLELVVVQGDDLQSRILYALHYGPNGLKWKDFGDQQETIECPERVRENQWPNKPNQGQKGQTQAKSEEKHWRAKFRNTFSALLHLRVYFLAKFSRRPRHTYTTGTTVP